MADKTGREAPRAKVASAIIPSAIHEEIETMSRPEIIAEPTSQDFAAAVKSFQAFGEAIVASQPKRKITVAELKFKTPFNPTGAKRRLPAVVFQNGARVTEETLLSSEIALLDKLKRGTYFGGLVRVRRDPSAEQLTFYIDYDNATFDQRMNLSAQFRSFQELLQRLTSEAPDSTE